MTVKAIYENGVFTPVKPVNLPEKAEVEIVLPEAPAVDVEYGKREEGRKRIMQILSMRFNSGQNDLAARHNKHQP